jgi:DedD protein
MAQSISDEELQLKKRARRRLVGAIALMLLAVVFLPMVLDKEPKPVGQDITIRIPSQEATPFRPQTAVPVVTPKAKIIPEAAKQPADKVVAASEAQTPAEKSVAQADVKSAEAPQLESQPKSGAPFGNTKSVTSDADEKQAQHAAAAKQEPAAKPQGYEIQLGAFANMNNAKQRQARLNALGVRFYTEKIKTPGGEKLRIRAGPYATREEAEKVMNRLKAQGIKDGVIAEKNS